MAQNSSAYAKVELASQCGAATESAAEVELVRCTAAMVQLLVADAPPEVAYPHCFRPLDTLVNGDYYSSSVGSDGLQGTPPPHCTKLELKFSATRDGGTRLARKLKLQRS